MKRITMLAAFFAAAVAFQGCNTTPTQDGAVLGGLLGAGTGAIIGHQSGHQGEGALIGAGAGALTGALIGDHIDESTSYRSPAVPRPRESRAAPQPRGNGHYETRLVRGASGELYEEPVWVPHR
jgi:outer membrane lipoprotein SlyB